MSFVQHHTPFFARHVLLDTGFHVLLYPPIPYYALVHFLLYLPLIPPMH
jgi:hypothetical protein